MKAIRFERTGGPEVLQWTDVAVGNPGHGEVRLRQTAVGVNFIDTYHRTGLYPLPLPSGIGQEAAGVVEAVGPGVKEFRRGDRVTYAGGPIGAYAEERVFPAERLVKVPKSVSDQDAAALMLKGMTARYLLRKSFPVKRGDWLLVHAAAGGVGSVLVPWARKLGARIIGTAGSDDKLKLAAARGAHHGVNYRTQDFVAEVKRITGGRGVDVVYDSVGKDTFMRSLDCLRPLGMLVSYGNASGKPPDFDPLVLSQKGSLFLTRPTLFHYVAKREELLASARDLFRMVAAKVVKADIGQTYALKDAAKAHTDLEARRTHGSTVLLP